MSPNAFETVFVKNNDGEPVSINKEWAVGALRPKSVDNREPEFLTQLAKDIAMNLVFTERHIRSNDLSIIRMVFMPIGLGCFNECTVEYVKDIGMFYEYYDKASPRCINGMPMFFSLRILSTHDAKIVTEKVNKILEMMENL